MGAEIHRGRSAAAWRLARAQHGVLALRQLSALGFSEKAIRHRLRTGRLHRIYRGVYAVGRPDLSREARWMAAVLACGDGAFLTHRSAGALFGICAERPDRIEVGVRVAHPVGPAEIRVRRRPSLANEDVGTMRRIPVTSPLCTMIDLATELPSKDLARSVNEADKLDVIDVETLRAGLDPRVGQPGVRLLVALLDRDTFVLTEEELERLFLPLVREVGLSHPMTKQMVNGFEVDFYWPDLKFVVETDGLRYHRTPFAQAKDARRDQAHTAAGYTRLRFSHHQVKYEPGYVLRILSETTSRLNPRG
jgi:very-short-patch-repair endonuclease